MTPRESAAEYAARDAAFWASRASGKRCGWFVDRGYGKGRPCCNDGKVAHGDLTYCATHYGTAQDEKRLAKQPAFEEAMRDHDAAIVADMEAAEASERLPETPAEHRAVALAAAHPWPCQTRKPTPADLRVVGRPALSIWYGYACPETGKVGNCQRGAEGWRYPPEGTAPVILAWIQGDR